MRMRFAMSAILGAVAVAAGAFGAHVMKGRIDPGLLEAWRTGSDYHLAHSVLLVALSLPAGTNRHRLAWTLLACGVVLFSGSLYAMAATGVRGLRAITPIGGVLLVAGWVALASEAWSRRGRVSESVDGG